MSDNKLKLLAIKKSREMNYNNFCASITFINNFKKQYDITSRKVTKFVTKKNVENKPLIDNKVKEFRETFAKNYKNNFNYDMILNSGAPLLT